MNQNTITHASVFSGIGGPEVAAIMLGWKNLFHCEINPFGKWRTEALKAYGNAIVPQVMYEIFRAIDQIEHPAKFNDKNERHEALNIITK